MLYSIRERELIKLVLLVDLDCCVAVVSHWGGEGCSGRVFKLFLCSWHDMFIVLISIKSQIKYSNNHWATLLWSYSIILKYNSIKSDYWTVDMEINQINFVIAFEIAKAKWLHLELVPWIQRLRGRSLVVTSRCCHHNIIATSSSYKLNSAVSWLTFKKYLKDKPLSFHHIQNKGREIVNRKLRSYWQFRSILVIAEARLIAMDQKSLMRGKFEEQCCSSRLQTSDPGG